MIKLKPCPFCGCENIYIDGYKHGAGLRWRVMCLDCMGMVDPGTIQQKYRANLGYIEFYCGNEDSDEYGVPTFYDDTCEEWEEKE